MARFFYFKSYAWVALMLLCSSVLAQGLYTPFGHNRVAHKNIEWKRMSLAQDDFYFESGKEELMEYVMEQYKYEKRKLESLLQYQLRSGVSVVLFSNFNDYIQSNFGITNQQFYAGGHIYTPHNEVFVFFDGSYKTLIKNVKKGIAESIINEMILGGTMLERVQSSVIISLPPWFVDGLASYLAESWNTEMDNYMKDALFTQKFKHFSSLSSDDAAFAGHSFWFFIGKQFGNTTIKNILFQTRFSRSVESAISQYTGLSMRQLLRAWEAFFRERYMLDATHFKAPDGAERRLKKQSVFVHTGLTLSPNGKKVAFVTNNRGAYKVWVYDIHKKSSKLILKGGFKTYTREPNYFFPVVKWVDSEHIAILYHQNGVPSISHYQVKNAKKTEQILLNEFEWVKDFAMGADGKALAISAIKGSHLQLYFKATDSPSFEPLTQGPYDVNDLHFTQDGNLIFTSNMLPENELPSSNMSLFYGSYGLFYLDMTNQNVTRMTPKDWNVNYRHPVHLGGDFFSFVSDQNGIYNSYVARFSDQTLSNNEIYALTNYNRNILFQDASVQEGLFAELVFINGRYRVFISPFNSLNPTLDQITDSMSNTRWRQENRKAFSVAPSSHTKNHSGVSPNDTVTSQYQDVDSDEPGVDSDSIDSKPPAFITHFPRVDYVNPASGREINQQQKESKPLEEILKIDYFIIRFLDNSIINDYYFQSINHTEVLNTPLFSPHFSLSISDLMNNHVLEAGARLAGIPGSGALNGTDYYLRYVNRKGRMNKEVYFNRRARFFNFNTSYERNIMYSGGFAIHYPFTEKSRIEAHGIFREDQNLVMAIDESSLSGELDQSQWLAGYRINYVFDNTVSRGVNRLEGSRLKAFAENFHSLSQQGYNLMLGVDARHYTPIHRQIFWANRLVANTSPGPLKTAYYLGGPENWYLPELNSQIPLLTGDDFILQSLGAPVRGFARNARSGNSYLVVNSELRIPIVEYLFRQPLQWEWLKSLMIIGFADVGTAWVGNTPFSANNPYNTLFFNTPDLEVSVTANRNPFILGTGTGARIKIDSYYIKYDAAWGFMQDTPTQLFHHFSLGLDF